MNAVAFKMVYYDEADLKGLLTDTIYSKKWLSTFKFTPQETTSEDPILESILKEYKQCLDKKKMAIRAKASKLTNRVVIGTSMKTSRISLSGEKKKYCVCDLLYSTF